MKYDIRTLFAFTKYMFKQPQLLVSIYSYVELKRIYGCKVKMGMKIKESKRRFGARSPETALFYCPCLWENPLWSWQGLLENVNMNSRIYLLRFTQLKCLQTVGTVTQWWLKQGPTKAFKISANVSLLLHKWSNSRIRWTWNVLKYACTCSTIWCGSHRAQRRLMTSMTSQSAGVRLHVWMQSSLFQVASRKLHKLHFNGSSTGPSTQDVGVAV